MTVPHFLSKTFSYQDLRRGEGGGALCSSSPPGMIRQKYPGADRAKQSYNTNLIGHTRITSKGMTHMLCLTGPRPDELKDSFLILFLSHWSHRQNRKIFKRHNIITKHHTISHNRICGWIATFIWTCRESFILRETKLKVEPWPFKKNWVMCFIESLSKMMKNAFYFILKAPFVLKTFNFLSWLFGHVEKPAWLER